MRFALSAEQRQFAASLHEMLGSTRDGLWPRLAGLGVTALAVPESSGGLGGGPVDLAVAFEELGHHAVPGPTIESMVAVPTLLTELGELTDELPGESRWLPDLAAGRVIATLAYHPHVPYALDADTADLVLTVTGDAVCRAVPAGAPLRSVDATRRLFATVPGAPIAAGPAARKAAERALDLGVLACAAQLLGAGRAMLELTVSYAKQRTQFGRPIGQFQAVKHRLADVLTGLELARPLVYGAAVALADRAPHAGRDVSAAKIATAAAADRAGRAALQVHGAIGYTLEYPLSRWLTRVRALAGGWGTSAAHRTRVHASLVLPSGTR